MAYNININRDDLTAALTVARQVVEPRPANLVMKLVRVTVAGGFMYIDAGGHGNAAFTRFPAEHTEDLQVLIDPNILANVSRLCGETITISTTKNHWVFRRDSGPVKIAIGDPAAYPPLPSPKEAGDRIRIPREAVKEMVKALLCGTEETATLPTLWQNTALIRSAGPEYVAVASDGRRTAIVDGKCSSEAGIELLVPIKALNALQKAAARIPADVTDIEIGQDKRLIWIWMGESARMCFSKIETKFPDIFGMVLAKLDFSMHGTVDSSAVMDALTLVRFVGDEKVRSFRLEAIGDALVFATEAKDRGSVEESVPIRTDTGFSFVTGYNADYLEPVLAQTGGAPVEIRFAEMLNGSAPTNYPMQIIHQGEHVRASWMIQSLNMYPRRLEERNDER